MRTVNAMLDHNRIQKLAADAMQFVPILSRQEAEAAVRFKALLSPPKDGGLKLAKKGNTAELMIYEPIGLDWYTGEGMTPQKVKDSIQELRPFDELKVLVNSLGGDAFDGMAIMNILNKLDEDILVEIEGMAASAASVIAMAASPGKLRIHEVGMVMVHNAMTGLMIFGNKDVVRREADLAYEVLNKVDDMAAELYASRSGRPRSKWIDYMNKETYLSGQEAVNEKFADELIPLTRSTAKHEADKAFMKRREFELRLRTV